jgi:hypothetical protein
MRTADMNKSKYWRARDLEGQRPVTLTIADVSEELLGRGGHQETKCFLWFHESPKGLQLNKTRVNILEAAYGPDSGPGSDSACAYSSTPRSSSAAARWAGWD